MTVGMMMTYCPCMIFSLTTHDCFWHCFYSTPTPSFKFASLSRDQVDNEGDLLSPFEEVEVDKDTPKKGHIFLAVHDLLDVHWFIYCSVVSSRSGQAPKTSKGKSTHQGSSDDNDVFLDDFNTRCVLFISRVQLPSVDDIFFYQCALSKGRWDQHRQ